MRSDTPRQPRIPASELWTLRLGLLLTPHFFGSLNQAAIASMAPVIKSALALSYTEVGLVIAAYTGIQAVFGIPAGMCSDRFGIGFAIFCGFLLLASGGYVFAGAGDLTHCMLASGLMGAGYAFMNPATAKAVFDWFPRARRATAASLKQTGVPVAWMCGALTLPLSEVVHWQWIMLGLCVTSAGTGLVYLPMIARPRAGPGEARVRVSFADLWGIIRNKSVLALEFNGFLYHAGQQNLYSFFTLFMTETLRAGSGLAAVALQLVQAGSIAGKICIGAASDFLFEGRRKPVLAIAAIASALGVFGLFLVGPGWNIYIVFGLALMLGFFLSSGAPVYQTAIMEAVDPRLSGTAVGYHSTVLPAGKTIGAVVFGMLVDAVGFASAWLVTALLIALAAVVLIAFFREAAPADRA